MDFEDSKFTCGFYFNLFYFISILENKKLIIYILKIYLILQNKKYKIKSSLRTLFKMLP